VSAADTGPGADSAQPPGGVRAADVFAAELRPRPGGRWLQRARLAGAFVSELAWELIPSPSVHDVVVTRRDDGTEVLREPAGAPLYAGELLAQIRAELTRVDPESFLRSWSAPTPPDP
jgi:hypothetical protein